MTTDKKLEEIQLSADGHTYRFWKEADKWLCAADESRTPWGAAGPEKALLSHIETLQQERDEWLEAYNLASKLKCDAVDETHKARCQVASLERVRVTLMYYADEENYEDGVPIVLTNIGGEDTIENDEGGIARAALARHERERPKEPK